MITRSQIAELVSWFPLWRDVPTRGPTMPSSPATNQRHVKTDIGEEFIYDGTRWLSVARYLAPWSAISPVGTTWTATTTIADWTLDQAAGNLYLERIALRLGFATTNNSSNRWDLSLVDDAGTTLWSTATLYVYGVTASVFFANSINVAITATTSKRIYLLATKVGTPGALGPCLPTLRYRWQTT